MKLNLLSVTASTDTSNAFATTLFFPFPLLWCSLQKKFCDLESVGNAEKLGCMFSSSAHMSSSESRLMEASSEWDSWNEFTVLVAMGKQRRELLWESELQCLVQCLFIWNLPVFQVVKSLEMLKQGMQNWKLGCCSHLGLVQIILNTKGSDSFTAKQHVGMTLHWSQVMFFHKQKFFRASLAPNSAMVVRKDWFCMLFIFMWH